MWSIPDDITVRNLEVAHSLKVPMLQLMAEYLVLRNNLFNIF